MIHLWDKRALAKSLGKKQISQKEGMLYFLASSLLILEASYESAFGGLVIDWRLLVDSVFLISLIVFGCYKAYEANGKEEGSDFMLRAVALSVPIGIRVAIANLLFTLAMYNGGLNLFTGGAFADPVRAITVVSYSFTVAINIYFWWELARCMAQAAKYAKAT